MRPPRIRHALLVGCVLLAGAVGCSGSERDRSDAERRPSRAATPVPAPKGDNDAVMTAAAVAPQRPATSPLDAVTAYLAAEVAGRFDDSFALLSTDDRTDIGLAENWRELHATTPQVRFFTVMSKPGEPVVTETTFEPRIDETVGVIAGSARITWSVVEEHGGYVVDRGGTSVVSQYPDDSLVAAGVTRWLRQIERDGPPVGYVGSIVGQPEIVDRLASAEGDFVPGDVIGLDDWETPDVVTNAFGPEAMVWARVVSVAGPVDFDAVVAPYGDQWVVVGVVGT